MRNLPAVVDAVAEETAAEMIGESSLGHAREREACHVARRRRGVVRGFRMRQQQLDFARVRKLRSAEMTAVLTIERGCNALESDADRRAIERIGIRVAAAMFGKEMRERVVLRAHFVGFRVEPCAHAFQHLHERRRSIARRFRKIGAGEERHEIVR